DNDAKECAPQLEEQANRLMEKSDKVDDFSTKQALLLKVIRLTDRCYPEIWTLAYRKLARLRKKETQDYQTAIETTQEAIENAWWEADVNTGQLYNDLGGYYMIIGQYGQAKDQCERALPLLKTAEEEQINKIAYLYLNLGKINIQFGENERAINMLKEARERYRKLNNTPNVLSIYSDLASAYWNKQDFSSAVKFCDEGLAVTDIDNYPDERILLLENKASFLFDMGEYEKSRSACDQIFARPEELKNADLQYQAGAYKIRAALYEKKRKTKRAKQDYLTALKLQDTALLQSVLKREMGKTYLQLSDLSPKNALEYAQHALNTVLPFISPTDINANPSKGDLYNENVILEALMKKGTVLSRQNIEELPAALNVLELALETEDIIYNDLHFGSSQLQFLGESHDRHELTLDVIYRMYQDNPDGDLVAKAWKYFEKSRSVILRQNLADHRAFENIRSVAKPILQSRKRTRQEMEKVQSKIIELRQLDERKELKKAQKELIALKE
ncbi:MAG TPA: tetratricopeptide repeat protein, partial [Bacteroidetes bacterium]|nr:tetratricopeptide repeat protein [Bacteroidota bacterium]